MTTPLVAAPRRPATTGFQTPQVLTIAGGHFVHDIFTAFVAPLLPLIIEKLSLSLTTAGTLVLFVRMPALINPLLGYLADRVSLRYFVILAPSVTALAMTTMGLAPSYGVLVLLLMMAGISAACFHVPAPAMMARVAGPHLGRGMSFFMAAGETGRTVGPVLAVAAVSWWGLDGMWRLMVLGVGASLILWWRLHDLPPRQRGHHELPLGHLGPRLRRLFLVLAGVILPKAFLAASLSTFLPLLMTQRGASLWLAGGALSLLEAAGIVGALSSGTLSDWLGRRQVLTVALGAGPLLTLLFLNAEGWLIFPLLLALGLVNFAPTPVILAVVQEHFPDNRALANGLFMAMAFLISAGATVGIGLAGDRLGLEMAFHLSALVALLSVPMVWLLPVAKKGGED